jgi:hypothetical protein
MASRVGRSLRFLICAGALSLVARPVAADTLSSDELIIKDSQGAVLLDFTVDESKENGSLIFFPTFQANTPSSDGPTVLYEPDGVTISDMIGVAADPNNAGRWEFAFVSDSATESGVDPALLDQFLNPEAARSFPETSSPVDVSRYLAPLAETPFHATFASDGEATVPEPADGVALASLAGMGLIGMVWRRRRTAA